MLSQRDSLWPSTAEWPVLLHMERDNATMAGTAPNWTHWQERFPRVRHFVSISFCRDVVVLAGFHGMFAEHAAFMMEMLYQRPFVLRWPGMNEDMDSGTPLTGCVWLLGEFAGQLDRLLA